MILSQTPLSLI